MENIEVHDTTRLERVGAHSHITGLGLNERLEPQKEADGMVGQEAARRAAGIIVKMVQEGKIAGRAMLITGEPGSGKTALAMAISKAISKDTPFVWLSASEIFSVDRSKTEALMQAFRKAFGVRIKEEVEILEGEVTLIEVDRPSANTSKQSKTGRIALKTADMEAMYELGNKLIEIVFKERIIAGDIVQINRSSGKITKLGRSHNREKDFDAVGANVKFLPLPQGEVQRTSEHVQIVSLHDIDVINSRTHGYLAVFSGDTGEIKQEIRTQIDKKVAEWRDERKAEIVPGVLFIDEAHMLDLECFSFFNRTIESELSPLLIMATNRGIVPIRGTSVQSAHGIPEDLLDRCLIIRTSKYTNEEMKQILKLRADEEEVKLSGNALTLLTTMAEKHSLRYALQLIANADIVRQRQKRDVVDESDVQHAYRLFFDLGRLKAQIQA